MSIAKPGRKNSKVLSAAMISYIVVAILTIFAAAVSMTEMEETSVVRANSNNTTTNEVLQATVSPSERTNDVQEEELIETIEESKVEYDSNNLYTLSPIMYTVQSGDTLWKIAEEHYGDGILYPYIMHLNDMAIDTLQIGQVIEIAPNDITLINTEIRAYCDRYYKSLDKKSTTSYSQSTSKEGMTYAGKFFITGYDPYCAHCCGKSNGITASGKPATIGQTIATSSQFPLGTTLYIEGYGTYIVEDRGVGDGTIDVAANGHDACYDLTAKNVNVYVVK